MNTYIRYAKKADADAIALINSQSFKTAFSGIIPDDFLEEKFSYERLRDRLSQEICEDIAVNSIMFLEDKPVGMMTFGNPVVEEDDTLTIEIMRIYLLPEHWGERLGKEFMEWGLKELHKMGYKKVNLWVIEENSRARGFYKKMGFKHEGVTRIINPGREITDLRYERQL